MQNTFVVKEITPATNYHPACAVITIGTSEPIEYRGALPLHDELETLYFKSFCKNADGTKPTMSQFLQFLIDVNKQLGNNISLNREAITAVIASKAPASASRAQVEAAANAMMDKLVF